MISYISGTLEVKGNGFIVVETGGIGYKIFVAAGSGFYLAQKGDKIKVFTEMAVRENDISLYGFENTQALDLFNKLITVNGVGAKGAMAIFSALGIDEIKQAIVFDDAGMLTRANGIGKKIAQRIILDLKDKFDDLTAGDSIAVTEKGNIAAACSTDNKLEALNALMELEYTRNEAADALAKAGEQDTVEDYIKAALKGF